MCKWSSAVIYFCTEAVSPGIGLQSSWTFPFVTIALYNWTKARISPVLFDLLLWRSQVFCLLRWLPIKDLAIH
uniref:Uncharacterized protein n=1 Tax=Arundo donax TaxID=35708 RepID=A0A0A9HNI0_ARUDO